MTQVTFYAATQGRGFGLWHLHREQYRPDGNRIDVQLQVADVAVTRIDGRFRGVKRTLLVVQGFPANAAAATDTVASGYTSIEFKYITDGLRRTQCLQR